MYLLFTSGWKEKMHRSKFNITLEKDVDVWHTPVHGFTLAPQEFRVKLEERKANQC